MERVLVRDAIRRSLAQLVEKDGCLFECPIEENFSCDARKLHEVCINHRLANHLEKEMLPLFQDQIPMFVDIEFNREGVNNKEISIEGNKELVRPDIIIHNRKTGLEKVNLLIVECKKAGSPNSAIAYDRKKIEALMLEEKDSYSFGLLVIYGTVPATADFFAKGDCGIETETIDFS